jgi:Ca2+-transporting ATPase
MGLKAEGGVVLPILATLLLWINLVTDGAPALALGVDPVDAGMMQHPPRPQGERVVTPRIWFGILFTGVIMAAGTLLVLDATLPGGFIAGSGSMPYAQTMAFTTLVFFQSSSCSTCLRTNGAHSRTIPEPLAVARFCWRSLFRWR